MNIASIRDVTYLMLQDIFHKPIITQLVKKILSYGIRRFIAVFTKAHQWIISH
jgi:UTP-glucose-1-phosphate uridylyltransferase